MYEIIHSGSDTPWEIWKIENGRYVYKIACFLYESNALDFLDLLNGV